MIPSIFEDAMERSFLVWLQLNLQAIQIDTNSSIVPGASGVPIIDAEGHIIRTTGADDIPIQVVSCMPYEFLEKNRKTHALVDVNFSRIDTEGFKLGNEVDGGVVPEGEDEYHQRVIPYRYCITANINTYTSSGLARAKLDGMLRWLLEGTRRGTEVCPVYQWMSDTSAVSAFSTGASISVPNPRDTRTHRANDFENYDFLSHWTVEMKCPYVVDSITELVSSFDVTQELKLLV